MIVRIITVKVAPEYRAEFEKATVENHEGSLQEAGVLRFDVVKDNDDEQTYYLYEVYRSEEATREHKETAHYKKWKERVDHMMAGPRSSVSCSVIAPEEEADW
jgi:autoinducer 2-degrading protein